MLKSAAISAMAAPWAAPAVLRGAAAKPKVRLAAIGVGGKGWSDLTGAAKYCDVVAFCVVDTGKNRRGGYGAAAERWPTARRYTDFRKLIEQEHKNLDAVTVSTPDHMHAPATMLALHHGRAAYTQKPLTRTLHEARTLTKAAAEAGVATQMGNQHHSGIGYRSLVEMVQSGALGKIKNAHTWSNRPIWPQGIDRPAGSDPVPPDFDWDLWLGVAPERPFVEKVYHPFNWRGWYDFGAGALGDMGCHIIDPVVWSLDLAAPRSVHYAGPQPHPETFPKQEVIRYRFPGTKYTASDNFIMTWYDGGKQPPVAGSHLPQGTKLPSQGVLLVGEEGSLLCSHGGRPQVYPEALAAEIEKPRLEKWDHYQIWVDATASGSQPNSNFAYAGLLTEVVLLGVVASRVGQGELHWDPEKMQFPNSQQATSLVRETYRKGWDIRGLG